MTTIKMYDPYKLKDPTNKGLPAPIAGRTHGGKFNGYSILAAMTDNDFPIDSKYWRSHAARAWIRLNDLTGDLYSLIADTILPPAVIESFSWRMICEMVEAACDAAEDNPNQANPPIQAALDYLAGRQKELMGDLPPEQIDAHLFALTFDFERIKELAK